MGLSSWREDFERYVLEIQLFEVSCSQSTRPSGRPIHCNVQIPNSDAFMSLMLQAIIQSCHAHLSTCQSQIFYSMFWIAEYFWNFWHSPTVGWLIDYWKGDSPVRFLLLNFLPAYFGRMSAGCQVIPWYLACSVGARRRTLFDWIWLARGNIWHSIERLIGDCVEGCSSRWMFAESPEPSRDFRHPRCEDRHCQDLPVALAVESHSLGQLSSDWLETILVVLTLQPSEWLSYP